MVFWTFSKNMKKFKPGQYLNSSSTNKTLEQRQVKRLLKSINFAQLRVKRKDLYMVCSAPPKISIKIQTFKHDKSAADYVRKYTSFLFLLQNRTFFSTFLLLHGVQKYKVDIVSCRTLLISNFLGDPQGGWQTQLT